MDKIKFVNNGQPAINDTNLNQMQTNIENAIEEALEKIKNNITIRGNGDVTLTMKQWAPQIIPFNTVEDSNGSLLIYANNKIVVGAGVNHIKLYGLLGLWGQPNTACEIHVYKNNSAFKTIYHNKVSPSGAESRTLPTLVIPVKEGDTISLWLNTGYAGNYTIMTRASISYLTAEVVD